MKELEKTKYRDTMIAKIEKNDFKPFNVSPEVFHHSVFYCCVVIADDTLCRRRGQGI